MDAATRVDRDTRRAQKGLCRAVDVGGRRRRARRMRRDRAQRDVHFLFHRVPRHVDRHRTRPPAPELAEGLVDDARRVGDLHDALPPLGGPGERVELVVELVQDADLLADLVTRDLSGDHQHRRRGGIRGVQAGRRVEQAGPRYRHRHADAAAGPRVAVGHVGRGALVAHGDEAERLVAERGDDAVELDAGKPERHLHAFASESLDDRFTTGHAGH